MTDARTPEQAAQQAINAYDERRWEPGEAPTLAEWIVGVLRIDGFLVMQPTGASVATEWIKVEFYGRLPDGPIAEVNPLTVGEALARAFGFEYIDGLSMETVEGAHIECSPDQHSRYDRHD